MHVHLATERHPHVVAHLDASGGLAVGDIVPIFLDPARLHFFEPGELGRALVSSASIPGN
jgi:hypothetical protein